MIDIMQMPDVMQFVLIMMAIIATGVVMIFREQINDYFKR